MFQGSEQSLPDNRPFPKVVLIVEDHRVHGHCFATSIPQKMPYCIFVTMDSPEALHFVQHIKPQLFIFDYCLPCIDALELYDHLHRNRELQAIPALILSTDAERYQEDIKVRKLLSWTQPFDMDMLLSTIESLLASSTGDIRNFVRA